MLINVFIGLFFDLLFTDIRPNIARTTVAIIPPEQHFLFVSDSKCIKVQLYSSDCSASIFTVCATCCDQKYSFSFT